MMGYFKRVFLCLWIGLSFNEEIISQSIAPGFTHHVWTIDDGLPINSLNDITVTDDGFVWISTHNGMVRFDGLTHSDGNLFKVFNKANHPAFNSNSLYKLLKVNRHEFLALENSVGNSQSIVRYRDGEFETAVSSGEISFPYDMARLDTSKVFWSIRGGRIYSLTNGEWVNEFPSLELELAEYIEFQVVSREDIWVLSKNRGELLHIKNGEVIRIGKNQGLTTDWINAFEVDMSNRVWLLTRNGIEIIESGKASFLHDRLEMAEDRKGGLYIDPTMQGRMIYKRGNDYGNDEYIVTKEEIQYLSPIQFSETDTYDEASLLITPENLTNTGTGWLRVNNKIYHDGKPVFELGENIRGSYVDKVGGIWFVATGELHYIKKNDFNSYNKQLHDIENVYPILEDHEGVIWAGLLSPNVVFKKSSKFEKFLMLKSFTDRRYFSLIEDSERNLWFGSINGIYFWDRTSEPKKIELLGNPKLRFVRGLLEDSKGRVWAGSQDHILSRSKEGNWQEYEVIDHVNPFDIRFIYEDNNNTIWFGSSSIGLVYYDEQDNSVKKFEGNSSLPELSIRSMYQDDKGIFWLGLEGSGLVRMNLGSEKSITSLIHYNQSDGLHGQVIHSILEDDFGRFWMSSNSGIFWVSRFELENFSKGEISKIHSTIYNKDDGLPGTEANGGIQSAAIKTKDGQFLFSMISGIGIVYPDRINKKTSTLFTRVDELITNDSIYTSSKNEINLKNGERDLQFNYAAFNFELAPNNIRYRYKLEGYDTDWIEVDNRKEAYYTNVPGGDYNFIIQSALFGYDWSVNESTLPFSVQKYFYETLWFKFLIALGLVSLLYSGFKWRIRSSEKRAEELTALVEAQTYQLKEQAERLLEVDKAKSKFFANVSHEFRTPLTLIIGPLKDITKNTDTITKEATEKKAKLALRNSNRLLKLVNQILDISKVESGTMELKVSEANLVSLIQSIVKAFGSLAEQRQVKVDQQYSTDRIPVFVDTDSIEKVLVNILSNAFKFTPTSGNIDIKVNEDDEFCYVEIMDSGPGVEEHELVHIFDRFYQTNESNAVNQVGTGIGLALTKELVELHKGIIKAESEVGSGLKITISLKKGKTHFEEHQLAELMEVTELKDKIEVEHEEKYPSTSDKSEVGETTILLIDDNEDIRSYLHEHLSIDYQILEEENGLEGLKSAKKNLPDIIICDVMMPKMDGYEFCKALKDDPETDFIPVILLTAKAEQSDKLEGLGLGADDYIMKPFDIEEVKVRASNLIQSRKKLMDRYSKAGINLQLPISDVPKAELVFIEEIRDLILEGMDDEDFSVEELAQQALTSRRTLHNRIKKITGKSASDLIREIRLERAYQLLKAEAGTISEIAYSVGFKSIAHFSRVFKEQFKLNPSEVVALKNQST
ncbi:MAG: two-component regulator propeller domain-containing protein [Balneolaceae bacterium]